MARSGPPAYAWDWFARQRLLWRESRSRLARPESPAARRYGGVESRAEVVALLRADYGADGDVRAVVDGVVRDLVFLGRTSGTFASLGLHNPPRGLRWWWSTLTGEDPDAAPADRPASAPASQLSLSDLGSEPMFTMDEVHGGYGDERPT